MTSGGRGDAPRRMGEGMFPHCASENHERLPRLTLGPRIPLSQAVSGRAAGGTRTHDLLHGKGTPPVPDTQEDLRRFRTIPAPGRCGGVPLACPELLTTPEIQRRAKKLMPWLR